MNMGLKMDFEPETSYFEESSEIFNEDSYFSEENPINVLEKDIEKLVNEYETFVTPFTKIKEFLLKISPKHRIKKVYSVEESKEPDVDIIFILKIDKDISSSERSEIDLKIFNECLDFAEKNNIVDSFNKTAIFLRR